MQVLTETLNYLAAAIQDFGLAAFDVPSLLTWAKADLGSAVAGTRTAAIAMVGVGAHGGAACVVPQGCWTWCLAKLPKAQLHGTNVRNGVPLSQRSCQVEPAGQP